MPPHRGGPATPSPIPGRFGRPNAAPVHVAPRLVKGPSHVPQHRPVQIDVKAPHLINRGAAGRPVVPSRSRPNQDSVQGAGTHYGIGGEANHDAGQGRSGFRHFTSPDALAAANPNRWRSLLPAGPGIQAGHQGPRGGKP